MEKLSPVRRALISVFDKSKLVSQAKRLARKGVELVSTGGSRALLEAEGLKVIDVSELTGFPEMMQGRVKTLHPVVHGGLLAHRDLPEHREAVQTHQISLFDLLIVNLYPFEETVLNGQASYEDCIEKIDIGGPAMIRAAAKNHLFTTVCTDPQDVDEVLEAMEQHKGQTPYALRQRLAAKAFSRTAAYDSAIANWFSQKLDSYTPEWVTLSGRVKAPLRYGENPHQKALFCGTSEARAGVSTAKQIQGKALSYNNINDLNAAFTLVSDFPPDKPAVAIIKHANPCGVAIRNTLAEAYQAAFASDSISAFGGIIALNQYIDAETAEQITQIFTEAIMAPDASPEAKEIFAKKPKLRLLLTEKSLEPEEKFNEVKTVSGGFLVQTTDYKRLKEADLNIVTKRKPSDREIQDMLFSWQVVKHVKSNAIVYARDHQTLGIGAGQTSRLDSAEIATQKAIKAIALMQKPKEYLKGMACASDAFFPFADSLLVAARAGARAIIQPGGSIKDREVIQAADQAGLTMAFTGVRHFRH